MKIGKYVKQPQGYSAFVLESFPPKKGFNFSSKLIQKANMVTLKIGKLDGITQLLPNLESFLLMYIRKDATLSSQIEGTKATMIDSLESELCAAKHLPDDVDDILHYIHALKYGMERINKLPLSLRLIREIHRELMIEGRQSNFSDPGNFRISQNWIGGTNLKNASFVPPPPNEMFVTMDELEKFFYSKDTFLPIIKVGLIHAQFETIHPFLDGNGRTGRMLITLCLKIFQLLNNPVLFLSHYLKPNQQDYYEKLKNYSNGDVEDWLEFFLEGLIITIDDTIETIQGIEELRKRDIVKFKEKDILYKLFEMPIVNVAKIQEWTGYTRQGSQNLINRLVKIGILKERYEGKKYGRVFLYKEYLDIFGFN